MPTPPPEVFISYSSEDKRYKNDLLKQLQILARHGVISTWHDGLLVPGQQWDKEIIEHLKSSRVILLLISPDFLVSDYVNNVELKLAAEREKAGEVCVIPVLVINVNSWKNQPFGDRTLGDFQAVPAEEKFIIEWSNRAKAFAEVARGIQEAVEKLQTGGGAAPRLSSIPRPPTVGFVSRQDVERQRDLVERLKEELAPEKEQVVALWGMGGVGKTTLAAETARELEAAFAGRIVWTSAYARADFTFAALLDEIATQLGQEGLRTLAPDKKAQAVSTLVSAQPTLIVLDNFETISPDEQVRCIHWLTKEATCPALVTTRVKIGDARNIQVGEMSDEEASEFLNRLIEQAQDKSVFTESVCEQIIKTAEANPYVMEWVYAQIDLADDPQDVFADLSGGKGEVAERVFDRSFNLPQLGEDGRAVLLALALFVPDASRDTLGQVAGFSDDTDRVREAIKRLGALRLITTRDDKRGRRLAVEGLTRSLAKARLAKEERAAEFRQRFVAYFLSHAVAHAQSTPEGFNALEVEKDNLLEAMDVAFNLKDWSSVMQLMAAINLDGVKGFLTVRGYWDEAIRRGKQAAGAAQNAGDEAAVAMFTGNIAEIRRRRGEYDEAKRTYQQTLAAFRKLGIDANVAVALHQLATLAQEQGELAEARRLYDESLEINRNLGKQSGIAITLHNLAVIAQAQGELAEARRLYQESLEIKKNLGEQRGIANTLHQLGNIAADEEELAEARRLYDESLDIKKRLGDQSGIANTLHALAILAREQGELTEARRLFEESLTITEKLGDKSNLALIFYNLGALTKDEGNKTEAVRLWRESLSIFEKLGSPNAEIVRQQLERVEGESS